jgi:hydrogenase-1 operon protein HyaF
MTEANACSDYALTHNVVPILHEIRHALRKLLESGEPAIIDLRAMPFAPGEENELEQRLGRGEVTVQLNTLGPSEIRETAIAGVWLITHYNDEQEVLGKFIEVTRIPSIIMSQSEDVEAGLKALDESLLTDS